MTLTPPPEPRRGELRSSSEIFKAVNTTVLAKLHGLKPDQTGEASGIKGSTPRVLAFDYNFAILNSLKDMVAGKVVVKDSKIHTVNQIKQLSAGHERLAFRDLKRIHASSQAIAIITQAYTGQNTFLDSLDSGTLGRTILDWKSGKSNLPPGGALSESRDAVFIKTQIPGVSLRFTNAGRPPHSLDIMYDSDFVKAVTLDVNAKYPLTQIASIPDKTLADLFGLEGPYVIP